MLKKEVKQSCPNCSILVSEYARIAFLRKLIKQYGSIKDFDLEREVEVNKVNNSPDSLICLSFRELTKELLMKLMSLAKRTLYRL